MKKLQLLSTALLAISILATGAIISRPIQEAPANTQPITYMISWSLSAQESIEELSVNLESVQAVSCEVTNPVSNLIRSGFAHAGHSDEAPNPALVNDIDTIDLHDPGEITFKARLDEAEYCGVHIAVGSTGSEEVPSLRLESSRLSFSSRTATGYRHDFSEPIAQEDLMSINIHLSTENLLADLDNNTANNPDEAARMILNTILTNATYTPN